MKAILLAGGRGTRMGDLTADTPKPLIRVGGRLLIERVIEKVARVGIEEIIISTGYLAEQFESVLGDGSRWGVQFRYSEEESPRGTGGALALAARRFLRADDTVVVLNADLVSEHSVEQQVMFHESHAADLTVHVREVQDPRRFGVVRFDHDKRVTAFIEKPEEVSREWINAGTYVVRGKVLLNLPETYPLSWEREVMPNLIESGVRVFAFQERAYFRDAGTQEDISSIENDRR